MIELALRVLIVGVTAATAEVILNGSILKTESTADKTGTTSQFNFDTFDSFINMFVNSFIRAL